MPIELKQYSKRDLRYILKNPMVDLVVPDIAPLSQRSFNTLVNAIYKSAQYKDALKNFPLDQYKPAKRLPISVVRVIFNHVGINFTE